MSRRIRTIAAALAVATALVIAAPALAYQDEGLDAQEKHTPILVDAILLRPLGLVGVAGGFVIGALPTAMVLLTRPTDVPKTLDYFIGTPFRYTFMDPLGQHSPVRALDN